MPITLIKKSKQARKRVLRVQVAGFTLAICSIWIIEYFSPPFDYRQCLILTLVVAILGLFTIYWTRHMLRSIRYLEGFMVICAACKKAHLDEQWIPIDQVIHDHSELQLSHGICPECAQRLYGDLLNTPLARQVS
jgi:hypothetical protein